MSEGELEISNPKAFNPLLRYIREDINPKTFKNYHYVVEEDFFEEEWNGITGLFNCSHTVFVCKTKDVQDKIEKAEEINCAQMGYADTHFNIQGIDGDYERNFVYFALRVTGVKDAQFCFQGAKNRNYEQGLLIVHNDKFCIFIAPRLDVIEWRRCECCGIYIDADTMWWKVKQVCPRCGATKWRDLFDGE
ncbi:MAG: hypothetical protein R6U96_04630 [Promethearchaeia archaeon]